MDRAWLSLEKNENSESLRGEIEKTQIKLKSVLQGGPLRVMDVVISPFKWDYFWVTGGYNHKWSYFTLLITGDEAHLVKMDILSGMIWRTCRPFSLFSSSIKEDDFLTISPTCLVRRTDKQKRDSIFHKICLFKLNQKPYMKPPSPKLKT